jgi:hypothetical protein
VTTTGRSSCFMMVAVLFAWLRFRDDPLHKFLVSWETWLWKLVMHRRIIMENTCPALLLTWELFDCKYKCRIGPVLWFFCWFMHFFLDWEE